nr:hypothetical protein [Tanacetum cinerariifolium]
MVQIWARSGFDEIEEFFLWMLSCKALNNLCQHKWKHYEDPNRDGERGFDYLTSALVLSKAYREGCRASRDGLSYWKLAREEECEGLRAKCEAAMTDFDKNPIVLLLREKMHSLAAEAKEHKGNLDRLMLESQKWSGYQVSLSALESKVASLEAEKANLEATEASLGNKGGLLGSLYHQLLPSAGAWPRISNDIGTAIFSWLNEYVADASDFVEALLSKNPPTLQKSVPLRT